VTCLSCLSVLPAFLSRSWGFEGPPRNLKLLTKYWDRSESPFLRENFGLLSSSFNYGMIGSAHPDLYSAFTLITEEALSNASLGKDKGATHVTSEDDVLKALGAGGGPLTLAQLSDFFSPFLDTGRGSGPGGTCIVVGDTPSDRLLFWNLHHRFGRLSFSEITTLRVPVVRASDDAFLECIGQILRRRGARGHNGQNDLVSLHSCSLDPNTLEQIAVRLRQGKMWIGVRATRHSDHAAIVPPFRDDASVRHSHGGVFWEPEPRDSAEFQGRRAPIPLVCPWHMQEALPPAGLRAGIWMLDLSIDREIDHCRYVNQRHTWRLPRRIRIERAFEFEREGAPHDDIGGNLIRVVRPGFLGIAMRVGITRASITMPDDLAAFRAGICSDWEWMPFDSGRGDAPRGRPRFANAEYSDKGRYLIGVLQLFESLPDAFSVLMHGYWRGVLHHLRGAATGSEEQKRAELLRVLRKRVGKHGPLTFADDDQLHWLAREALRAGRMIAREPRYIPYAELNLRWKTDVEAYLTAHPSHGTNDSDARFRNVRNLDRSVQYLCQREALFQGREWRCRSCYNRNWVGINDLNSTLACSVCRRSEPAPVSGDWQFRLNPFVLEAYRDHGIEAAIWALWTLSDRSRNSFYFVPSLKLWLSHPGSADDDCDAEVDSVAVVDGTVYLVEAKSSSGLNDGEIRQLLLATDRVRPDVLLVACMSPPNTSLDRAARRLRAELPTDTKLEVLTFNPAELACSPFLPASLP
jgi:hypothetical protein